MKTSYDFMIIEKKDNLYKLIVYRNRKEFDVSYWSSVEECLYAINLVLAISKCLDTINNEK